MRGPQAAVVAIVLGAAVGLLVGCSDPEGEPGIEATLLAEIVEGGPDCLADEVLVGIFGGTTDPGAQPRPAPVAGAVPDGLDPETVVLCRAQEVTIVEDTGRLEVPPEGAPAPDPDVTPTGGPAYGRSVEEVTLTGDLGPLLAELARPSVRDDPSVVYDGAESVLQCPAVLEFQPQIYLVDVGGRAVRPAWPTDRCGFLLDGATEPLDRLTEADVVVLSTD